LNDPASPEVARGRLAVACVSRPEPQGPMTSITIPRSISDKIGVAKFEV